MMMVSIVVEHPETSAAFGSWAANNVAGEIFMWALTLVVVAYIWPEILAPVRSALVQVRDAFQAGGNGRVGGMMLPVAEQVSGDFYTPAEAARLLGRTDKPISERRIRQMLQAGELEGRKDDNRRWHVAQHEVHRLIQERRQTTPETPSGGPERSGDLLDRVLCWSGRSDAYRVA